MTGLLDLNKNNVKYLWGFPGGTVVKKLPANAENLGDVGLILVLDDSLECEMATHSSILAWEMQWTEESGKLQYMGSQKS